VITRSYPLHDAFNHSSPNAQLTQLPTHCLAFLSAQCCAAVFIALFFTRFWLVSALYAAWWFIDREKPSKGGRRIHAVRNSIVWRYMRDYFPVTVSVIDPMGYLGDSGTNFVLGA